MLHQKMVKYSLASARDDGASNRVIMVGKNGYLGYSSVYLRYLENGVISISGNNTDVNSMWKLISYFRLEPGMYTLTGLRGARENTIALQLYVEDALGFSQYIYQYDEDVQFAIDTPMEATLHIRVYPYTEGIDFLARPAVYRDD